MKIIIIVILFFLFMGCSDNPVAPTRHNFFAGNIDGDFGILVKTTDYCDIGDGAVMDIVEGLKTTFTVKDFRLKSVRDANPIVTVNYWKNNSRLSVNGRQAILSFEEGLTELVVEIITEKTTFTLAASIFGVKGAIPEPLVVGNSLRGVLCSDKSILEEIVLLEEYLEIGSVEWATITVKRIATGYWFINRHGVKGVSENGVSKRMFEFLNSRIKDELKYKEAVFWTYLAIMYSGIVNEDSVEAFYLRFIIESPQLCYADDNRRTFNLLQKKDNNQFLKLVSDIVNNPSSYADKDSLPYLLKYREAGYENDYSTRGSESLVDIAKEKSASPP